MGFVALVAMLVIIGAGVWWVADPLWSGKQSGAATRFVAVREGTDPTGAVVTSKDSAGQVLQMSDVATTTPAHNGATATSIPTSRQWDTVAAGVIPDAVLARRLDQALAGVDGQLSVAVKDLGSGRGAVFDGERELPAASLYKLPVLFAVFETGLTMGEELPITDEARAYDSGTLELGVGETLTVAEALERMVTISDNTAAVMLGSRAGGGRVNADIAALGMVQTHYSLERMTTSASDMLHFLDLLAHGKMVSTAASADMVHLLLRQRVNDRLPRLLPSGVEVAHKTGNLPGTVNDVGIIYGPSTTLAVAALVSDTADETAAATAIARVALAAFTYFEDQPEASTRPTIPQQPARPIPPVWREPHPVPTATTTPQPEGTPSLPALGTTPVATLSLPTAVSASVAATAAAPVTRPTQASASAPAPARASAPTSAPAPAPAAPSATSAPAQPTPTSVAPPPTRTPVRPPPTPTPAAPAKR